MTKTWCALVAVLAVVGCGGGAADEVDAGLANVTLADLCGDPSAWAEREVTMEVSLDPAEVRLTQSTGLACEDAGAPSCCNTGRYGYALLCGDDLPIVLIPQEPLDAPDSRLVCYGQAPGSIPIDCHPSCPTPFVRSVRGILRREISPHPIYQYRRFEVVEVEADEIPDAGRPEFVDAGPLDAATPSSP